MASRGIKAQLANRKPYRTWDGIQEFIDTRWLDSFYDDDMFDDGDLEECYSSTVEDFEDLEDWDDWDWEEDFDRYNFDPNEEFMRQMLDELLERLSSESWF